MNAPREADVLAACLQLLKLRGVFCWRQNQGVIPGPTGPRRFVGLLGVSDILGVLGPSGRLLAVEVKRPGGRLSPHQALFLDAVRAAGGVAVVVSDVRQLDEVLKMEGMVR